MATISKTRCLIGITVGSCYSLDKHPFHSPIAYQHPVILNRVLHLDFVHLLHPVEYRQKPGVKTMTKILLSRQ